MGQVWAALCKPADRSHTYHIESTPPDNQTPQQPQYSWDQPMARDPKDFILDGLVDETIVKHSGDINGQQFVVQNCKGCTVYLLDHSASINLDDCENCKIVIGPCKGSVFIRDCKRLVVLVACQQLRTRDCTDIRLFVHCATQPSIEESTKMKFGCLQLDYPQINDQYKSACLSPFNNNWSKVHDFTKTAGANNYTLLEPECQAAEHMPMAVPSTCAQLNYEHANSAVPHTLGRKPSAPDEHTTIAMCFCENGKPEALDQLQLRVIKMIRDIQNMDTPMSPRLVSTSITTLEPTDLDRILDTKTWSKLATNGPVICLHWQHEEALSRLRAHLHEAGWPAQVCHLANGTPAKTQLAKYKQFTDVQANV